MGETLRKKQKREEEGRAAQGSDGHREKKQTMVVHKNSRGGVKKG